VTGSTDNEAAASGGVPRSLNPAIPSHPSEFACIDLINSTFTNHLGQGPPIDRLPLTAWRSWFLERHGLRIAKGSPAPLEELAELRRRLRRLLERWSHAGSLDRRGVRELDRWVSRATLHQRIDTSHELPAVVLEPVTRDWTWVTAAVAASAVELIGQGAPSRLKVCANPDCSWMFYDHSHNVSRRFCSTSPCASIVRVRRLRRARLEAGSRKKG
jgi:predicted RNA-binding Zn ribbon-like protein